MPSSKAYNVLIVDDSTTARAMLRAIVEGDPMLRVMATAADAYVAARQMRTALPDVMLLDLELPGVDGLTFLRKIMAQHPLPVVVCSSQGEFGSENSIAALESGALEVILKPNAADHRSRQEAAARICAALRAAAETTGAPAANAKFTAPGPKRSPDEIMPAPLPGRTIPQTEPLICIGASTGGTEALRSILTAMPADAPAIAIVQHMPQGFTAAFAKRMNTLSQMTVVEAVDGMTLTQGTAVIAAGDRHIVLRRSGTSYKVQVVDGPPISRHRPSVDVLFRSAATVSGPNAMGVILTGMGDDGALCMGEMRAAGSVTIAQDEASSVVWGMPREALRMGAAQQAVALDRVPAMILNFAKRHRTGAAT